MDKRELIEKFRVFSECGVTKERRESFLQAKELAEQLDEPKEPCDYCKDAYDDGYGNMIMYWSGTDIAVKFCPACGRPLNTQHNATERTTTVINTQTDKFSNGMKTRRRDTPPRLKIKT